MYFVEQCTFVQYKSHVCGRTEISAEAGHSGQQKCVFGEQRTTDLHSAIENGVHSRDVTVYTRKLSISCIVYRVSCIHIYTRNFINTRKYMHEIFRVYKFLTIAFTLVLSNIETK